MMTGPEALLIRARLQNTQGWSELAAEHPKFAAVVESLPDDSGLALCNVMLREMFEDARKWAQDRKLRVST